MKYVKMKYSEKWRQAYDNRNREALSKLLDIDCHFIKYSTGEKITKEQILDMWTTKDRVKIQSHRIVYESDEILVQHWFLEWPNSSKGLQTLINFIQYRSDQLKLKKDLGLFIALSTKTWSFSVS